MTNATRSLLPALLASLLSVPALASDAVLTVEGQGTLDAYLGAEREAFISYDATCETARGVAASLTREQSFRITAMGDKARVSGLGSLAPQTRALADQSAALLDAVRRVTGASFPDTYLIRASSENIFIGIENKGGRSFTDACNAMGYFLALLAAQAGIENAMALETEGLIAGLSRAPQTPSQEPIAVLSRGQIATLRLSGLSGRGLSFAGPPGVEIFNIQTAENGDLILTARVSESAALGDLWLTAYAPGSRIRAADRFPLRIAPGGSSAPAPIAATSALPLGAPIAGSLTGQGSTTRYTIRVDRPGQLAIESEGLTDTSARLVDGKGTLIAQNDDGGASRNFRMENSVEPGIYTLEVSHATGGGGDYVVRSQFTP